MRKVLDRLPRLSGRSLYLMVLVVMMMLYDFNGPVFRVPMVILVLPWGCGVTYAALQTYRGKLGLRNWLLVATSALLIVASIRSGDLGQMTLYALGGEIVCLLGAGIVPEGTDTETLRRELLAFAWTMILFMLPLMLLSTLSVFLGHAFRLGTGIMGIQHDGVVTSRVYIVAHPDIGGRRAEMCILFAIYALTHARKSWQRVLLGATIVLSMMVIAHSQTRSCSLTLGMIFAALIYRAIYLRLHDKKWRMLPALAGAAVTAVLTLAVLEAIYRVDVFVALRVMPAVAHAEEIGASRTLEMGLFNISESGRMPIWEMSLQYLKAHPGYLLLGTGAGDVTKQIAVDFPRAGEYAHLHNSFLEILVRGGMPMLLCSLALLVSLIRPCYRMLIAPETDGDKGAYILPIIIGSMLAMTVSESMLFIRPTVINLIFFLALGRVAYAARHKTIGQFR